MGLLPTHRGLVPSRSGLEPSRSCGGGGGDDCLADFTKSADDNIDCRYHFTDTSTIPAGRTITDWFWDFDDGTTSTSQNPSHTFPVSDPPTVDDVWDVQLTITLDDGSTCWQVRSVYCGPTTESGPGCFDYLPKVVTVTINSWPSKANNWPCSESEWIHSGGCSPSGSYTFGMDKQYDASDDQPNWDCRAIASRVIKRPGGESTKYTDGDCDTVDLGPYPRATRIALEIEGSVSGLTLTSLDVGVGWFAFNNFFGGQYHQYSRAFAGAGNKPIFQLNESESFDGTDDLTGTAAGYNQPCWIYDHASPPSGSANLIGQMSFTVSVGGA